MFLTSFMVFLVIQNYVFKFNILIFIISPFGLCFLYAIFKNPSLLVVSLMCMLTVKSAGLLIRTTDPDFLGVNPCAISYRYVTLVRLLKFAESLSSYVK